MEGDTGVIVVVAVLVGVAVVVLGKLFSKDARTKRLLRRAPRVVIRDAPEGVPVKITGTLHYAGEPLTAPLTDRPCALWEVRVEEYRSSGKSGHWRTIIDDYEARDFYVDDGTGKALVKTSVLRVASVKDATRRSGTFNDASPELEALLSRYGKKSTGLLGFNKSMRYHEGVFEQGEQVTVLGLGRWETDPDGARAGYRERPRRLVVDALDEGPLVVSDDPSVG